MSTATIIDGKAHAARLRSWAADAVVTLQRNGIRPGLAVILVGDDPASAVYVRNKIKQTTEAGLHSEHHALPATTGGDEVLALIARLNADPAIDGILVQLPLPAHINTETIVQAVDPAKDVDGFALVNVGALATGARGLVPCTPLGCLMLIKSVRPRLGGLEALVVGRSNIVGKPMAQLLLKEDCTVTIAHSRTRDLAGICRRADIVVAAVGRPGFVRGDWITPGAIVIDVGINRVTAADGTAKLVGDVDFAAASQHAGAITPVPGGVGPMTIACLLRNTIEAACRRRGLAMPPELLVP